MLTLELYDYAGHPDTVNKTLGDSETLQGVLRDNFNLINPVITLRQTPPTAFNYVFIPSFSRFYFVDSVNVLNSDKIEIRLTLDVLKTYEAQILEATATVGESDNPDKYVSNRSAVYNVKPNFSKVEFPNTGLFDSEGKIIMVTIKGDK